MAELRDLYQEVVLDHGKKPRNFRELPDADGRADGHNPLCGDRLTVWVRRDGDRVGKATFRGSGCAISTASASMMTQAIEGKTEAEIETLFRAFHDLVAGSGGAAVPDVRMLGKLVVLGGVREFPVRVKCATLAWHTLRAALENRGQPVSTE
jgi:nitrogen fixation NifU-like protein